MLVLVAMLMGVSLEIGWVGELLHRARQEAEGMALVDREAELPNRRHLGVLLDAAFGAAERGGRVAVVLFGLDAFSALADARGRGGTGAVLRVLTPILS